MPAPGTRRDEATTPAAAPEPLEAIVAEDGGTAAWATHRGRRHERNEDAAALALTAEGWPVVVVADGVSTSPNPDKAAAAAAAAAAAYFEGRHFEGHGDLVAAVLAANEAASAVPREGDDHRVLPSGGHPACTIVIGVTAAGVAHVANVGDARAYLLRDTGDGWEVIQGSSDDSLAARAIAQGADPEEALAGPGGHTLVAWLGADAPGPGPNVASYPVAPGDVLLACSDGLWNYAPTITGLQALVEALVPRALAGPSRLGEACEHLVDWAVGRGGADNVTVGLAQVLAAEPALPPEGEGGADTGTPAGPATSVTGHAGTNGNDAGDDEDGPATGELPQVP